MEMSGMMMPMMMMMMMGGGRGGMSKKKMIMFLLMTGALGATALAGGTEGGLGGILPLLLFM